MAIKYFRNNYLPEAFADTEKHVREHISSIASPSDDPIEFYNEVDIEITENKDGSLRVFGVLDQEPACDYSLPEDYVPPPESTFQQGFGERIMESPQQLHEHLMQKEVFE